MRTEPCSLKLEPDMRYLIIHADDGGLCHSVNQSIITALQGGLVTSTSLMVPCSQFKDISNFLKQNPQYDTGIHLTLTCEYPHYPWGPISDKEKVASLVNSKGYFWHSVDEFLAHAKPEHVESELRAQITQFLESGIQPTHLDTHQGVVFKDFRFLEIYVQLGLEYKIPPMLVKPDEKILNLINKPSSKVDDKKIKSLIALGIPFLEFLFLMDNNTVTLEEREGKYINAIKQSPIGVSQIIIHPGIDDKELKKITSDSYIRHNDLLVFTNSHLKQLINELNIKLIGWKEFAKLT